MISSQRRSARLPVRTLVCNLDHWNEGTVLNVSEGGLALQAIAPINPSLPVHLILDWAECSGSIEAGGEVKWNDHGRVGIRFSTMSETSRGRLIEWLFQDVAARCLGIGGLIAAQPSSSNGLFGPVSDGQGSVDLPSAEVCNFAEPAPEGSDKLRLTALLAAEHQYSARGLEFNALLDLLAKRAQCVTGASGAAIALGNAQSAICVASSGALAPDRGSRITAGFGLSGECLLSGAVVRSNDLQPPPRVDANRVSGIRSLLLIPLFKKDAVVGVLGVFSEKVSAFDDSDLATLHRMRPVILSLQSASERVAAAMTS